MGADERGWSLSRPQRELASRWPPKKTQEVPLVLASGGPTVRHDQPARAVAGRRGDKGCAFPFFQRPLTPMTLKGAYRPGKKPYVE
jgi:hypothetical protein